MTNRMGTIDTYVDMPYEVEVVPDLCTDATPCYRASHPELPGCMSHGTTVDEALANLEDAKRLYIETLLKRNLPVPRPKAALYCSAGQARRVIWTLLPPVREQVGRPDDSPDFTRGQFEQVGKHVA